MEWTEAADPVMVKWVKDWFASRKEDGYREAEVLPPMITAIEDDPVVSACIVTCHNYGRYLKQCLDSILQQTKKFTHVVVVNDSSTDDTDTILNQYRSKVKVVKGDWRDFTEARKAGLEAVPRTRFLLFVDADNWLPHDYHEQLMTAMDDPRVAVAYGKIRRVNDLETQLGPELEIPYDYHRLRKHNYADACSLIRTADRLAALAEDQQGGLDHEAGSAGGVQLPGSRPKHEPAARLQARPLGQCGGLPQGHDPVHHHLVLRTGVEPPSPDEGPQSPGLGQEHDPADRSGQLMLR